MDWVDSFDIQSILASFILFFNDKYWPLKVYYHLFNSGVIFFLIIVNSPKPEPKKETQVNHNNLFQYRMEIKTIILNEREGEKEGANDWPDASIHSLDLNSASSFS